MTNRYLINVLVFLGGIFLGVILFSSYIKLSKDKVEKDFVNDSYAISNKHQELSNKLESDIINQGNIKSYNELRVSYIDKDMFAFLPWALIMANKYNNNDAYFDVYYCLFDLNCTACNDQELENWSLDELSRKEQDLAIYYLMKASEKGHSQAKEILDIYKVKGKYLNILH